MITDVIMASTVHEGQRYGALALLTVVQAGGQTRAALDLMLAVGVGREGVRSICTQDHAAPWLVLHGLPVHEAINLVAHALAEVDEAEAEEFRETNEQSCRIAEIVYRSDVNLDDEQAVRDAMKRAVAQIAAERN